MNRGYFAAGRGGCRAPIGTRLIHDCLIHALSSLAIIKTEKGCKDGGNSPTGMPLGRAQGILTATIFLRRYLSLPLKFQSLLDRLTA